MQNEAELAQRLIDALADGRNDVDPQPYASLDLAAAVRIQALVQSGRHEDVRFAKVAVPQGLIIGSPIFTSMTTSNTNATVSSTLVQGIEVEVAAILGQDIRAAEASKGEHGILEAIDRFVVGIELIGSRFTKRSDAGLIGELADNLSTAGYVTDPSRVWGPGADVTGATVEVSHDGNVIYSADAKHVFGSVLASLLAYAGNPFPSLPLKKGMIVTTGTLCGMIEVPGPGRMIAGLNDQTFELNIV
ncbi:hypothetical protein [Rhizobium sp. CF142]|uniref:hypothetical protein n=1 Tax=Rhizobium sp. CF142 TaxID=1144314 RepID=UPI00026EEB08|nr:hypothetical protein [Rhizobium sp. CF142]EJJ31520.1 2-keto-4-pentenoate hydratase [Rhizobium sp. CF142]